MSVTGHIHQGAIVPDIPLGLPEGARVEFVLANSCEANRQEASSPKRRQGGWLKGQIRIAEDFDELPSDIAEGLGASDKKAARSMHSSSIEDWAIFRDLSDEEIKELDAAILHRPPSRQSN